MPSTTYFKLRFEGVIAQPNYSAVPALLASLAILNTGTQYVQMPFLAVVVLSVMAVPFAATVARIARKRQRSGMTSAASLAAATGSYVAHGDLPVAVAAGVLIVLYVAGEILARVATPLES